MCGRFAGDRWGRVALRQAWPGATSLRTIAGLNVKDVLTARAESAWPPARVARILARPER